MAATVPASSMRWGKKNAASASSSTHRLCRAAGAARSLAARPWASAAAFAATAAACLASRLGRGLALSLGRRLRT